MRFTEFGFKEVLLEGIESLGFETATPIQEKAIPLIMEGRDMLASAQTGTGKTAAFLLPVINRLMDAPPGDQVRVLVIVPTRELAQQIDQHMEGMSYFTPVSSIAIYGGTDGVTFEREKRSLTEGADVVICTPGRFIAHLNQGYVKISGLQVLILDEADRMLDMGFFDDIMKIISYIPAERQTLMFSATMPADIRHMAKRILKDPAEVNIAVAKPADKVLQAVYMVTENRKIALAKHLLRAGNLQSVLVFCSTKKSAKNLCRELKTSGLPVAEIHSDLDQQAREKVMLAFRNRQINILVATDILSRGIDIEDIDMVMNYDVPHDGEDYIHRIGRTARAASEGMAITFVSEKEKRKFAEIEKLLGSQVFRAQWPQELGSAPEMPAKSHAKSGEKRPFNRKKQGKRRTP